MNSSTPLVRRSAEEQTLFEKLLVENIEHHFRFNELIGLKVKSLDPQSPALTFDMRPELVGNYLHQRLHGGVIATALDTAGGFTAALVAAEKHANETAAQIMVRFSRFSTIDMRVDYLHQGTGHSFIASAKVLRLGGRIATVQMELRNDSGLLIAVGSASYVIS